MMVVNNSPMKGLSKKYPFLGGSKLMQTFGNLRYFPVKQCIVVWVGVIQ